MSLPRSVVPSGKRHSCRFASVDEMIKVFNIAIPNDGVEEAELNRFLVSHRIVSVRTQWVTNGDVPYEVFTVEYAGRTGVSPVQDGSVAATADAQERVPPVRVDYRKILEPEQFIRYCKMRDERKKIAEEEAVKAFVVFTNEQLASIARLEKPTLAEVRKIGGIGEARAEKYGARIIAALGEATVETPVVPVEVAATGETPVVPVNGQDARSPSKDVPTRGSGTLAASGENDE